MSEEIAWAVADIALQQRLIKRARRWKRCATRVWGRLRAAETQRAQLEAQLASQKDTIAAVLHQLDYGEAGDLFEYGCELPAHADAIRDLAWCRDALAEAIGLPRLTPTEAPGVGVGGGGEQA